jgi:hypothetical protein
MPRRSGVASKKLGTRSPRPVLDNGIALLKLAPAILDAERFRRGGLDRQKPEALRMTLAHADRDDDGAKICADRLGERNQLGERTCLQRLPRVGEQAG